MIELNWQQSLANDRVHFVVGKVDVTNYFNFHGLLVPWQHFMGYGASVSGTVSWPDQGFGLIASFNTDKFYLMGGLTDVRGDLFQPGQFLNFGSNFFKGNFFKVIELGYAPSFQERYFRKIGLTYWHADPYTPPGGTGIDVGQGLAFSFHWYFKDRFIPFFRLGFSNGNGENAFFELDLQIGHGLRFRSHDILGLAFGFARPNIPGTSEQLTLELFYRLDLTEHLAFTPDFQFVFNPTLNPNTNFIFYWAIRGRVTL